MAIAIRSLTLITLASTLVACSGKPADSNTSAGAPAAAATASTASSNEYQGVPIYPGMTTLTTNDIGAGEGMTLHSGNFRSTDPQEKILAFYREALTKQFGGVADMPGSGEGGMIRIAAGNEKDKLVTILIRAGDSGEQIVGIQVVSK